MSFNGWHLIWVTGSSTSLLTVQLLNKSSDVRGTTRIRLRSFVISDLHQLCVPGATIWGINDFNVCWWHSSLQADSSSWKLWWSTDRHWCHPWMHKHLSFNTQSLKMQTSNCFKEEATSSPTHVLFIGNDTLEQVDCYSYLGVLVTSKISWADHIEHIVAKPGDLLVYYIDSFMPGLTQVQCSVSMSLALEYACQLWDPYPTQGYTVTGIDTEICL